LCIRPDNAYLGSLDAQSRALLSGACVSRSRAARAASAAQRANAVPDQRAGAGEPVASLPWLPAAVLTKDFGPQQTQGIRTVRRSTVRCSDMSGEDRQHRNLELGRLLRDRATQRAIQIGDDYRTQ
jgi:hypothetical protein